MNTIISIIAGFLSGLIGAMGFGGGGVLIIYLSVFLSLPQLKAQGINLIFFIPCAVVAVIIYAVKKQIDFKAIYPVILGGILGAVSASFILKGIETAWLSKIFAVFLIIMGIKQFISLKKQNNVVRK